MGLRADKFHAHLDACKQCANQPFNLCMTGAKLLHDAVDELVGPKMPVPAYMERKK